SLNQEELSGVQNYLGTEILDNWHLIRKAEESVARLAIIPMQDILNLPASARMNKPGTTRGNWIWRMQQKQLNSSSGKQLLELTRLYGRAE
ncbi:MAG: 4-alpha-glucanotransferase, partial [Prolixibacteraceae bacterium]|nr:4-alpha-glucanotransferase [Prolixibacteraceae bacterium]